VSDDDADKIAVLKERIKWLYRWLMVTGLFASGANLSEIKEVFLKVFP
jgi:hypothetical protein